MDSYVVAPLHDSLNCQFSKQDQVLNPYTSSSYWDSIAETLFHQFPLKEKRKTVLNKTSNKNETKQLTYMFTESSGIFSGCK